MSSLRAHVALLVDPACLAGVLAAEEHPPTPLPTPQGGPAGVAICPTVVGRALVRFAGCLGRVALARAYGDWTDRPAVARALAAAQLEPVLVPPTGDGCARGHVRLAVDALQCLYAGDEPDAYVLATADGTLLPLVQALRADGSEVVLVCPAALAPEDLRAACDRFVSLEEVLAGVTVEGVEPRAWRSGRGYREEEPEPLRAGHPPGHAAVSFEEGGRRERPPHPTPVRSEADFAQYDWAPFLRLIDELEHRLPFVGVRYLVNKVLGAHNCGVEDPRLKRDLINRAVDDGLIEMYPVGNVGDRADPVTACRLDRRNAAVVDILGPTTPPVPPVEEHGVPTHAPDADDAPHAT